MHFFSIFKPFLFALGIWEKFATKLPVISLNFKTGAHELRVNETKLAAENASS